MRSPLQILFVLAVIGCVACNEPRATIEVTPVANRPSTPPAPADGDDTAGDDTATNETATTDAASDEAARDEAPVPQTDDGVNASPAASAMSTIFSPARAPKRKTMGLLQRSFLDLADQGDQELEVAIVVDGTDSMATELAGVRTSIHQMLNDLRQYRNSEVRTAMVVYRDAGSPSGEVTRLLSEFTADESAIEAAVQQLQPESGAPYFHELTDEGVHTALTELPWSEDDQVAKWILLFGDAPPYSPNFADAATPDARRRYSDAILVSIAKRKNIRINCVLCTSGGNVSESYTQSVDQTRTFMNTLAAGTDGLMLDLSYEAIRTAMIDAANQPEVGLVKMEPISSIDLAVVRKEKENKTSNARTVSLAVIPHMPLSQITFAANNPAVRVSTAIRTKLARVPGVRVASPRDIKEQLRRVRSEGLKSDQAIRGLAGRLGVDFVVWGELLPEQATYQTAAYRREDGKRIVPVSFSDHPNDTAFALVQASAKEVPDNEALAFLMSSMESLRTELSTPMSSDEATNDNLLTAIEALEQALAYESASEESVELLKTADQASQNARSAEPTNAIAWWLQSNVAYNQAARLFQLGQVEAAEARMNQMRSALAQAARNITSVASPSLVTEIEADYYLLFARNPEEAIKRYEAMTAADQPSKTQLRGHWMLSGIQAGDWGLPSSSVDLVESRRHLIQVLANWPDSPEAELLKQWMRWDETDEQTQFNYLPTVNLGLTGAPTGI